MKKDVTLNLKLVAHTLKQLMRIDGVSVIKATDLAKELGVSKVTMIDFIDQNKKNFNVTNLEEKKSYPLAVKGVFENSGDNPENEEEYMAKQTSDFKMHLDIEEMNNYGSISGHYITYKTRRPFVNTQEKVESLVKRFDMKPAQYSIGGFGDSSTIKPEAGFRITESQMETLITEGWILHGLRSK